MPGVPVSRRRGPSYAGAGATFTKLPLVLDPKDLAGVDVAIVGAQALVELGLASTEPILVGGEPVRPRDVLAALARRLPQATGTSDTECLQVVLEGVREGRPARVIAECVVGPDPVGRMGGGHSIQGSLPPSSPR